MIVANLVVYLAAWAEDRAVQEAYTNTEHETSTVSLTYMGKTLNNSTGSAHLQGTWFQVSTQSAVLLELL